MTTSYFPKPRKGKLPKNVDQFGMFYCESIRSYYDNDLIDSNAYINLNMVCILYIEEECVRLKQNCGGFIELYMNSLDNCEKYMNQFYKRVLLPYKKWKKNNDPLVKVLKEMKEILMYQPGGMMSKIAETHFKKISNEFIEI